MPTLPQYEQQVSAQGGSLGPGPVGDLGFGNLIQVGQQLADDIEQAERRESVNTVARSLTDLRLAAEQSYLESQRNLSGSGEGFASSALKSFDALKVQVASRISNRETRSLFNDQADQHIRADIATRAFRHEHEQGVAARKVALDDSLGKILATLEINPDSRGAIAPEILVQIDAAGMDPAERALVVQRASGAMAEAVARGRTKRDPLASLKKLETTESGDPEFDDLPIDARRRLVQYGRAELVDQHAAAITAEYERSADAGVRALSVLSKSDLPADLRTDVAAQVAQRVNLLRSQRRQEHAEDLVALDRAIATDTTTPATEAMIDRLYQRGALTVDEYGGALARMDESVIRRAKAGAGATQIAEALASGIPLDPGSSKQREALADYFAAHTNGLATGSEPWRAAAQAVAQTTRMLPDQALAWTRSALRSPDPGIAAAAAQFVDSVNVAAPDALSILDDKSRSFADLVSSMIAAGTQPGKAIEVARENVFQVREDVLRAREKAWSGSGQTSLVHGSSTALAGFVDRDFDEGLFSAQPATTSASATMVADALLLEPDFRAQTERYFRNTGDIARAREMAWQDVRRIYQPSEINGVRQMFAFPPERYGVTREDVESAAADFLKANPQADGTTPADVVLVPDALTLRNVGDALEGRAFRPSYALVGKSGDVLLHPDGSRARFEIPGSDELAARLKAAEDEAAGKAREQVQEAKHRRESIRKMQENWPAFEGY